MADYRPGLFDFFPRNANRNADLQGGKKFLLRFEVVVEKF